MPSDAPSVLSALRSLEFCRGLGASGMERLAAAARPVQWAAGQTIYREGELDPSLYLILSGTVAIEVSVPGRGRARILTLAEGEPLGWSSVYQARPKAATATAVGAVRGLAWDAAALRESGDADHSFGYWLARRLLETVSGRLRTARLQLLDVFAG